MSETLTPTNGCFEAPIKNLDSELIVAGVENIGISIKSPTEVAQNLSVLNHEFGISAEAYEDTTTSILLTGVAELTAELEARKEGMTIGQYVAEMEYVADLVMGIAGGGIQFLVSNTRRDLNREDSTHQMNIRCMFWISIHNQSYLRGYRTILRERH